MTNDPRGRTTRGGALIGSLAAAVALALITVLPVLANPVPTNPNPPLECPDEFGSGLVTKYVTTLTMPSDSNDWWVSVEVTVADENGQPANCQLTLATYELPSAGFVLPQTLHDSDTQTVGAGTHTLTAALPIPGSMPDCFFQYDFVFGPAIQTLVFEDRYGDRQIRARIGPDETGACPQIVVNPTATPTPSPTPQQPVQPTATPTATPTPDGGALGGNPTPRPLVPNTGSPASVDGPGVAVFLGALVLVAAGGSAVVLRAEAVRSKK